MIIATMEKTNQSSNEIHTCSGNHAVDACQSLVLSLRHTQVHLITCKRERGLLRSFTRFHVECHLNVPISDDTRVPSLSFSLRVLFMFHSLSISRSIER